MSPYLPIEALLQARMLFNQNNLLNVVSTTAALVFECFFLPMKRAPLIRALSVAEAWHWFSPHFPAKGKVGIHLVDLTVYQNTFDFCLSAGTQFEMCCQLRCCPLLTGSEFLVELQFLSKILDLISQTVQHGQDGHPLSFQ